VTQKYKVKMNEQYNQVHEHPTGHQGRESPALTGAPRRKINKNATSLHKIQRSIQSVIQSVKKIFNAQKTDR